MSEPRSIAHTDGRSAAPSLDELYRRYRGPIQGYLYRLCGSADLAEELTQETFARACAAVIGFRGDSSVATWLFRIARNVYLNSLRRPGPLRVDTDELLAIPDHAADGAQSVRGQLALERRVRAADAPAAQPERNLLLRWRAGLAAVAGLIICLIGGLGSGLIGVSLRYGGAEGVAGLVLGAAALVALLLLARVLGPLTASRLLKLGSSVGTGMLAGIILAGGVGFLVALAALLALAATTAVCWQLGREAAVAR